ncbi:hypothetical protein ACOMHN_010461 [Nucella lapillus]
MVEWKGSVEGDGGRKAIMVDDSQPSSSGGAGEGSDVASRQRLKMTGTVTEDARAGQNRITVMLLVICGVYTFLVLPELIFSIVVMLVPGLYVFDTYHNTVIVTITVYLDWDLPKLCN